MVKCQIKYQDQYVSTKNIHLSVFLKYVTKMIYKCATLCICAIVLLLTVETSGAQKQCLLRTVLRNDTVWNHWAGYYCYNYTNKDRLKIIYNVTSGIYEDEQIPVTRLEDTIFTYSYKDFSSLQYVEKAFKTDHFFKMWKDCCREAEDCCTNTMNETNINSSPEYPCPAIWDGWSCFLPEKANRVQRLVCSKQAYSTDSNVCELLSEKTCFANGTWNQKTNYGPCSVLPVLRNRHNFNVIVLAVATVLTVPAVVIFFSFRVFRNNLRLVLHRNLVLVIVIRNLLTIMSKQIIILDALKSASETNSVMANNSVDCRVLAFFENVAKNGMFACMLADGFYLHKMIVRAFANEPSLTFIYSSVIGLTLIPSLTWAIVRSAHDAKDCWMVDGTNDQWIIDGYRIAVLATNFLLLIDIIRVMVVKLKRESISQQARSTLRATLFLIPLFGLHIVIIMNRGMVPDDSTCQNENIYYYVSYLIEGLQGVMVAVLFCYINAEVLGALQNSFRKIMVQVESRFGITFQKNDKVPHRRRTTAATFVDPY